MSDNTSTVNALVQSLSDISEDVEFIQTITDNIKILPQTLTKESHEINKIIKFATQHDLIDGEWTCNLFLDMTNNPLCFYMHASIHSDTSGLHLRCVNNTNTLFPIDLSDAEVLVFNIKIGLFEYASFNFSPILRKLAATHSKNHFCLTTDLLHTEVNTCVPFRIEFNRDDAFSAWTMPTVEFFVKRLDPIFIPPSFETHDEQFSRSHGTLVNVSDIWTGLKRRLKVFDYFKKKHPLDHTEVLVCFEATSAKENLLFYLQNVITIHMSFMSPPAYDPARISHLVALAPS